MARVRPGAYKLTVHAGRFDGGSVRRVHKTVEARSQAAARKLLPQFIAEVNEAPQPRAKTERDVTVDDAMERFLEHLAEDKGREDATIRDYRSVHTKWFSPWIGARRVRDVTEDDMDRLFGKMRRAGMSASRMQSARNLYGPFFRWARRRRIIARSPMAEFELPTSTQVPRERMPPDAEQLSMYLATALEVIPDVVPLLTLAAVTGMRRGELVPIRRSKLEEKRCRITVDTAIDGNRLKLTKTRTNREVAVDEETMDMLLRHCDRMDERALAFDVDVAPDAFVFSHEPDCSVPMSPGYVTHQVARLREHLGIADKRPATIELEDEALRLFRLPPEPRPAGRRGPAPKGGLSYQEIGRRLGRTGRWAKLAVDAATRREQAAARPPGEAFDGSILALRKFTSSELLDAGFNIAAVVTDQECAFLLCVTVTATPSLAWSPGEPGSGTVACSGSGSAFDPSGPPAAIQAGAPGACAHAYGARTGAAGRPPAWSSTASVTWALEWTSTSGASGTLPAVTREATIERPVEEVQAVVAR